MWKEMDILLFAVAGLVVLIVNQVMVGAQSTDMMGKIASIKIERENNISS